MRRHCTTKQGTYSKLLQQIPVFMPTLPFKCVDAIHFNASSACDLIMLNCHSCTLHCCIACQHEVTEITDIWHGNNFLKLNFVVFAVHFLQNTFTIWFYSRSFWVVWTSWTAVFLDVCRNLFWYTCSNRLQFPVRGVQKADVLPRKHKVSCLSCALMKKKKKKVNRAETLCAILIFDNRLIN